MYCPVCRSKDTKVVDSRLSQDTMSIRRRRECDKCKYRFSTLEEMELLDVVVVKSDGKREIYCREKIEHGVRQSLTKRPFTDDSFRRLINAMERDIQKKLGKSWTRGTKSKEITSKQVGDIVMRHLKKFDKVAYIRFASVYRSFEDVNTFHREAKSLLSKK
ncbi:MAG: transcriptional regulator NrdR [Candidatus Magasanikbacteria bacterium]